MLSSWNYCYPRTQLSNVSICEKYKLLVKGGRKKQKQLTGNSHSTAFVFSDHAVLPTSILRIQSDGHTDIRTYGLFSSKGRDGSPVLLNSSELFRLYASSYARPHDSAVPTASKISFEVESHVFFFSDWAETHREWWPLQRRETGPQRVPQRQLVGLSGFEINRERPNNVLLYSGTIGHCPRQGRYPTICRE